MTQIDLAAMSGVETLKLFNDNVALANSLGIAWAKTHTSGWTSKAKGAELTAKLLAEIAERQGMKAEAPAEVAKPKRTRSKKTGHVEMPLPRKRSRKPRAAA
jgi:hypothetical protein